MPPPEDDWAPEPPHFEQPAPTPQVQPEQPAPHPEQASGETATPQTSPESSPASRPEPGVPAAPETPTEPELPSEPDPVAADGFAGFIPRHTPDEEPFAPAFAKSEAELREEFKRRFSDIIPSSGEAKKPQREQAKPAGSRFADMVAQYAGQQPTTPQAEPAAPQDETVGDDDDDYASDDDEIIEESGIAGRRVVEEILNARLIEERNADGTPKV